MEQIFQLHGVEALSNDFLRLNLAKVILDDNGQLRTLSPSNFIVHKNGKVMASKDFRTIIKSHVGRIPEQVMYNISSVALLMIAGIVDYKVANQYIKSRMSNYGVTELVFRASGYLIINIDNPIDDVFYRSRTKLKDKKSPK